MLGEFRKLQVAQVHWGCDVNLGRSQEEDQLLGGDATGTSCIDEGVVENLYERQVESLHS